MTYDTINNAQTVAANGEGTLLAGRYRVVRQLGQGGMGSVWLAEDTQLDNKPFAIKMLPAILVANKRAYRQLKDEALVAMRLVHPNIVQIRAFEENNGNPFLVMDYVDGQTLDDYLAEKGKLSGDETIRLLKPIAAALDYAHAKGVVHRDVKPGNVMIAKDGTPCILDFGIAREIQETLTRVTGKLSSGTLLYMSPEQLNGAQPRPPQDVYSFAAMAYECLKGEPPFVRGQIEHQILNNPPPPLPVDGQAGGAMLALSVMSGLAKRPEDRPLTCMAVLNGCFQRKDTGPRSTAGVHIPRANFDKKIDSPSAVGVPPPLHGGKWKTWAVMSVLGLIAVGGVWYYRQEQVREQTRIAAEAARQKAAAEETKRKAEQSARQKVAEEAKRKAEEAARQKATEEAARRQAEEDARHKAEEATRRQAEEDARHKAEEEARLASKRKMTDVIRSNAMVMRDMMEFVPDTDGFNVRKDELETIFARAEGLFIGGEDGTQWEEAAEVFSNYVAQCEVLLKQNKERLAARPVARLVAKIDGVEVSGASFSYSGRVVYSPHDVPLAPGETIGPFAVTYRSPEGRQYAGSFNSIRADWTGLKRWEFPLSYVTPQKITTTSNADNISRPKKIYAYEARILPYVQENGMRQYVAATVDNTISGVFVRRETLGGKYYIVIGTQSYPEELFHFSLRYGGRSAEKWISASMFNKPAMEVELK